MTDTKKTLAAQLTEATAALSEKDTQLIAVKAEAEQFAGDLAKALADKAAAEAKIQTLSDEQTKAIAAKDEEIKALQGKVSEAEAKLKLTPAFADISEGAKALKDGTVEAKASLLTAYEAIPDKQAKFAFFQQHKKELLNEFQETENKR